MARFYRQLVGRTKQVITKFLTTDVVIVDKVVRMSESQQITDFVKNKGWIPGGKYEITKAELEQLQGWTENLNVVDFPGGSASNMIRTMSKLSQILVKGIFVGAVNDSPDGQMIQDSFKKAGVELKHAKNGHEPQPAISMVIKYPNGERCIATYLGNAHSIIKQHHFTDDMFKDTDCILLQGSIAKKLDHEVIAEILKHRWVNKKQLVLALPTSAFKPDFFWDVEQSANIVMSNTDELGHIFGLGVDLARKKLEKSEHRLNKDPDDKTRIEVVRQRQEILDKNISQALHKLQEQQTEFSDKVLAKHGFNPQVAFITDGLNGSYIVTSKSPIKHIACVPDDKIKGGIVNKLGSGDNSFAGFVFAKMILNYDDVKAAEFAMVVAAAKLQFNGPVMDDPWAEIAKIDSRMAEECRRDVASLEKKLLQSGGRVPA